MCLTTEEITGCIIEAAKGANKDPRNNCFFISCFTVSVTPSFNTLESSDYMILIISFITSFKINNFFSCLTAPFRLIVIFHKLIYDN